MSDVDPRAALKGLRVLAGFLVNIGEVKRYVMMASDGADALAAEIQAHEKTRREVERLRIGLMNAAHEAGQDPGGMTHPDQLVHPDIVEYALAAVRELRELYSEALEET